MFFFLVVGPTLATAPRGTGHLCLRSVAEPRAEMAPVAAVKALLAGRGEAADG